MPQHCWEDSRKWCYTNIWLHYPCYITWLATDNLVLVWKTHWSLTTAICGLKSSALLKSLFVADLCSCRDILSSSSGVAQGDVLIQKVRCSSPQYHCCPAVELIYSVLSKSSKPLLPNCFHQSLLCNRQEDISDESLQSKLFVTALNSNWMFSLLISCSVYKMLLQIFWTFEN